MHPLAGECFPQNWVPKESGPRRLGRHPTPKAERVKTAARAGRASVRIYFLVGTALAGLRSGGVNQGHHVFHIPELVRDIARHRRSDALGASRDQIPYLHRGILS